METWDALRSRRNVRSYADRTSTDDDLWRIAEAARRHADHVARAAAAIALVAPAADDPDTRETYQYDLGQATMSIMLAAADLGIGSCHAAVGDQEQAAKVLGVPEGHRVEWLLSLGYPKDRTLTPVAHPARRPFDDVVRFGRW